MYRLAKAFANSSRALARAFATETAVRQEMILLMICTPLAFVVADEAWRRVELIGAVLLIVTVELLNTAVEKLCDRLHPDRHDDIGYVKDLGSAAVLAAIALAALFWIVAVWQWLDRVL
jgi:diacylglycerol kinase (ATP)